MIEHTLNNEPGDQKLLQEFAGGSQAAFGTLVQRHGRMVYDVCLRQLNNGSLAEEATQAVFLILAQKARRVAELPCVSAWLFQTARFAAWNARKMEHRQQRVRSLERSGTAAESAEAEDVLLLNEALASLSSPDRDALLLRYYDHKTVRELAATLRVSEDAAEKRVARALERLKAYFFRKGKVCSTSALAVLLPAPLKPPLSAPLVHHIVQASTGPLTAGSTTAHVIAKGGTQTMLLNQAKPVFLAAVALAAFLGGSTWIGYAASRPGNEETKADADAPLAAKPEPRDPALVFEAFARLSELWVDAQVLAAAKTNARTHLEVMTAREKSGQTAAAEVRNAQLALKSAELTLEKNSRDLEDARLTLREMGLDPAAIESKLSKFAPSKISASAGLEIDEAAGSVFYKDGSKQESLFTRKQAVPEEKFSGAAARQWQLLKDGVPAVMLEAQRLDSALKSVHEMRNRFERGLVPTEALTSAHDDLLRAFSRFMEQKMQYARNAAKLDELRGRLPARMNVEELMKRLY